MAYSQERRASLHCMDSLHGAISLQRPASSLLQEQCNIVSLRLEDLVEEASTQCRRKLLWRDMKSLPRQRSRHFTSDPITYNPKKFTFNDLEELLKLTTKSPLRQHDSRLNIFSSIHTVAEKVMVWYTNLLKLLHDKYGDLFRRYTREDGKVQYAVVLIPGNEESVILLSLNWEQMQTEVFLLGQDDNEECDTKLLNEFLEDYINTLCFHMWSQMPLL